MLQLNELNVALRERLDVLETLWKQKDASAIVHQLYSDETEITGAGASQLYFGSSAIGDLVAALVGDTRSASIRIDRLRALAPGVAYTWVTWEVLSNAAETFNMKSLFVWKLESQGWRIVADMYADGVIPN
ncbi:DUF4440 domain-containing protein [Pseudomonas sp. PB101]|uniref:DUF4440 domain-containing protein n=1 Tax=Pseudomonas sp. PB101 TaxID=2495428 RepID=UPI0013652716|nr:DUF4440 domain-containing protein [Pseudomonas sp. PB101]MVW85793.1 DUF4440 domain-containing protein [Pseudomonas sp. PB101]